MILYGMIRKGVGGFYYVETSQGTYMCTARGKFRKSRMTPFVGDFVTIEAAPDQTGVIVEIKPRSSCLIRPPIANVSQLFIVVSLVSPSPNTLAIDKSIAAAEMQNIEPIIIITKLDLAPNLEMANDLQSTYQLAGIHCIGISPEHSEKLGDIRNMIYGKITALTGNTGVGKSTLLNLLYPHMECKTGEVSEKLGRGRHTTREVELFKLDENSYIADTPGFSTFDISLNRFSNKEQLIYGFRDFMPYFGQCKFTTCSHTIEKGCAILDALHKGEIAPSRFESYCAMYDEVKDIKQWEIDKNV